MSITSVQPATITVPADYLEDFRSAVIATVNSDAEGIEFADKSSPTPEDDRKSSARTLHESMRLLDQLLEADEDTTVSGQPGALAHALDQVCRILTGRLSEQMEYTPLDLPAVRELADRIVWATTTAEAVS